jgi:hypothetical protein
MYFKNMKIFFAMLSLMITILACGFPASNNDATEVPGAEIPITGGEATEIATTEAATQESTPPDQPIAIQHQIIPAGLPDKQNGQAGDFDSSTVIENKSIIGGDRFTYGRFERPFIATTMDVYFSELDIIDTSVFQDDTWIYGSIVVKEFNSDSSSTAKYAIELDTDLDGKGDWLIVALKPTSTEWAVSGVQIYEDANNDVGNVTPMLTDKNAVDGDGFESLVFDQGQGTDSDAAWVRTSPNNPNVVEISVKQSIVGNPKKYLINMWAGTSLLNPALFDLNDHFTHDQAGAADNGLQYYYPIKEVSEIDSSCRMAVGFEPTGQEPGLCEVLIPVLHGPGTIPGPTGCQATSDEISACNQDVYCNWSASDCSCICKIPG